MVNWSDVPGARASGGGNFKARNPFADGRRIGGSAGVGYYEPHPMGSQRRVSSPPSSGGGQPLTGWGDPNRNRGQQRAQRGQTGTFRRPVNGPTAAESQSFQAKLKAQKRAANRQVRAESRAVNQLQQAWAAERAAWQAQEQAKAKALAKEQRQERRSAYNAAAYEWETLYGIDSKEVKQALKKLGPMAYKTPELLVQAIRGTKSWGKEYGAVMKAREKKGLPFLNESSIIERRAAYAEELLHVGIGNKKARQYADAWIGSGVSMDEMNRRIGVAKQWVNGQDKNTLEYMREQYGVRKKDLVAYILDTNGRKGKKPAEWFQEQLEEARMGGAAKNYGFNISQAFAKKLANDDVAEGAANQAFAEAAQTYGETNYFASLSAVNGFNHQQLAKGALSREGVMGTAKGQEVNTKVKKLKSQERGRWSGRSGGSGAGAFGGGTSGNY